jgi:PhnB protein
MPKRSLIDQFEQEIQAMLEGNNHDRAAETTPLLRLAEQLRDLPRENFKARLKAELERKSSMSAIAESISAVRTIASPRLTFKDVAKAIDFYTDAFGAKELMRFETLSGIPHAEIMIGDSLVLLCDEWPEGGRYSAQTSGSSPVSMRVQVPDVDEFVKHAVAAGAKLERPVSNQFYGYREGVVLDPFSYSWSVFKVIEEMSVEEMHRRMEKMMKPEPSGKPAVEPVPKGFHTVTPYLIAENGPALVEFARQAFDVEEVFQTIGGAGGLHAEVRLGDSRLMIGGGIPGREFRATPNSTALHVYVENADAAYEKALAAGATSIYAPQDHEYGERSGSVKDPAGNFWYIATYKGQSHIPKGLNSVNVYMHPLRADAVANFIKRAFGATEIARYASPDGVVHHAEYKVGTSVIEMGEASDRYQPMKSMFYLYVPQCDAVYQRALAAGATSLSEPKDQDYGDRSGAVTDPFGNQWYIASRVKNA